MPSFVIGKRSGGDLLISGNPWSGTVLPRGGIQFRLDKNASGCAYIALSGGMTINSGGLFLSGQSGMLDGMQLGPGDAYFMPVSDLDPRRFSGNFRVWVDCDPSCSGQARMYYDIH